MNNGIRRNTNHMLVGCTPACRKWKAYTLNKDRGRGERDGRGREEVEVEEREEVAPGEGKPLIDMFSFLLVFLLQLTQCPIADFRLAFPKTLSAFRLERPAQLAISTSAIFQIMCTCNIFLSHRKPSERCLPPYCQHAEAHPRACRLPDISVRCTGQRQRRIKKKQLPPIEQF